MFIFLIFSAGILILIPISSNKRQPKMNIGIWTVRTGANEYTINLWMVLPLTISIGFASVMCGVSGGSFLAPLMVIACGFTMHIAVGTASTLIAATACMGFLGHAAQGNFNSKLALPLAGITIIGGIIGGKWALSTRPKNLKQLFAFSNIAAAIFMFIHIIQKI
ncbi:MAG: sulfite exporter TauE/SafE family protein [bacterium]